MHGYVCVCVGVHAHGCSGMWTPEVDVCRLPQLLLCFVLETGLLNKSGVNSPIQLGWVVSQAALLTLWSLY